MQSSSEHGTSRGTQTPPQFGQQVVPSRQRIAAHGFSSDKGTQTPEQSKPPAMGSQLSAGLSTQVYPSGHGSAAIPPHMIPGATSCAAIPRRDNKASAPPASPATTPRRDRALARPRVQRSNRSLSIRASCFPCSPASHSPPVNAGELTCVPGDCLECSSPRQDAPPIAHGHCMLIYVCMRRPAILPSPSAAAMFPADIVDARGMGLGRGKT
jgi:hypothetical protein